MMTGSLRREWTQERLLVMVLFVVAVFALLSLRSEYQDRAIEKNTLAACQRSNQNSVAINGFLDLLVSNVRRNDLPPAELKRRVAGYEASKVSLLVCR